MTFEGIPAGSAVFLDANIIVYYAQPDPTFGPACQQLMLRIENGELHAYTSSLILADVTHRIMTLEAATLFNRAMQGMAGWLKQRPNEVQQLSRHRSVIDDLSLIGVQVLPVTGPQVSLAADVSRQLGLLTDDALVIVVMRHHGLTLLASHDADFDRVPGLTPFAPA